jgi:protein-L-isoaspartate(D-aspartate) O-methyltransferase
VGSGYGTALAREVVGREGLVVAIDIDAATLAFARENLDRAGYSDAVLLHGDGGLGYPAHAPYDRICVTAACPNIPPPLIEQLAPRGWLIAPVKQGRRQRLTLLEKTVDGLRREVVTDVCVAARTIRRRKRSGHLSCGKSRLLPRVRRGSELRPG